MAASSRRLNQTLSFTRAGEFDRSAGNCTEAGASRTAKRALIYKAEAQLFHCLQFEKSLWLRIDMSSSVLLHS